MVIVCESGSGLLAQHPSFPLLFCVGLCLLFYFKALALQRVTHEEVFSQSIANSGKLKTINGMKKECCFGGEQGVFETLVL